MEGSPTIFQAIICNDLAAVSDLVDTSKGADFVLNLKAKDELSRTALYLACQLGHVNIVKRILDTGAANIEAADKNNWTPLLVSAYYGHKDVVAMLLDLSAREDTKEFLFGWTPLLASVWNGHIEVVQLLLAHNSDKKIRDREGRGLLILASQRGHADLVSLFLKTPNRDLTKADNHGRTALYMAVQLGHLKVVQILAESGVNVDQCDTDGRKPLYIASKTDNEEIAEYLVNKGASTDSIEVERIDGEGEPVKPCKGKFLMDFIPDPYIKVICMTEAEGRLWGGCTDGSIIVWSLKDHKILCYSQAAQKKAVHHMVSVRNCIWSLSGNREIFVWKWNDSAPTDSNIMDSKNKLILVTTLQQRTEINCIIKIGSEIFTCKEVRIDTSPANLAQYENFIVCIYNKGGTVFVGVKNVILGYDVKTMQFQMILDGHKDIITAILVMDKTLWSAAKDDRIRVWDLETRQMIRAFENVAGGQVNCLVPTRDDQILSGGRDGSIKSWSKESHQWKRTFPKNHSWEVACMWWEDSSGELWVGSLDKSVSVWK